MLGALRIAWHAMPTPTPTGTIARDCSVLSSFRQLPDLQRGYAHLACRADSRARWPGGIRASDFAVCNTTYNSKVSRRPELGPIRRKAPYGTPARSILQRHLEWGRSGGFGAHEAVKKRSARLKPCSIRLPRDVGVTAVDATLSVP